MTDIINDTHVTRPRILLADEHILMPEGLRKLLEKEHDVVGTATNGPEMVKLTQQVEHDLILMDIVMPKLNGLDAARRIMKLAPSSKVIFVTMYANPNYVIEAFRVGASAFLLKQSAVFELTHAIRVVLDGEWYLTSKIAKDVLESIFKSEHVHNHKQLTPRQREVLQLVGEGHSMKEIATILELSLKTVEFHKTETVKILGIQNTAEMIQCAIKYGLVGPPDPPLDLLH